MARPLPLLCYPDLTFEPLAVKGKVTVFDFYADCYAPCQKVDRHVYGLLQQRQDVAVRKRNVVSWDSALARRHLPGVAGLPYLRIYGRDGRRVGHVNGLDLAALDRAISEGAAR
ncbi:MAG: thioredoxin family protein [Deltaproteobacteria bacterium]|nr:thioredoxin family protein [Deltaproteobacteria bacterium]